MSICLPPFQPLNLYPLDIFFYHSLSLSVFWSVTLPLILSVFQSFSIYPPTHTFLHTYTHTHTTSIAIPERSRLVWQWVGLCPWTQWHPCCRCITPGWHHHSKVVVLQWRRKTMCTSTEYMCTWGLHVILFPCVAYQTTYLNHEICMISHIPSHMSVLQVPHPFCLCACQAL